MGKGCRCVLVLGMGEQGMVGGAVSAIQALHAGEQVLAARLGAGMHVGASSWR